MENSLRAGQWVLLEVYRQHLASWLNSLRLESTRKGSVSPSPSHQSQCQPLFPDMKPLKSDPVLPLECLSFLCKGLYPQRGPGQVGGLAPAAEPSIRGQSVGSMPGEPGVDAVSSTEVFLFLYRASVTASPFLLEPQTGALCQSPVTQLGRMFFQSLTDIIQVCA